MSLLPEIAPIDLGLPPKFTEFRPIQAEALDFILGSSKPFVGGSAPTGVGKSLLAVAAAVTSDSKAVYLTATKALQDQVHSDFHCIGMEDMRGRSNYSCRVYTTKMRKNVSCEVGHDQGCHLQGTTQCAYFAAYETAKSAKLISTNYSYWMHARSASADALEVPDGETRIELLICDEAHHAMEELSRFLAVRVDQEEYQGQVDLTGSGLMNEAEGTVWRAWATLRAMEVANELRDLREEHGSIASAKEKDGERYRHLETTKRTLDKIRAMDGEWVWEMGERAVSFDCIWPGRYATLLWAGVPRILLLSATLWPYTLSLLGLNPNQYDFQSFSNGWPPNYGPVFYLPTARLSYKCDEREYAAMVRAIDAIIEARSDRKGIVHTVSYALMRKLMQYSRNTHRMYFNESASESVKAAQRFREAKAPAVLISPSFSTGWDFSYEQCEYQIIPKVPFPYAESRVMKERVKDKDFRVYLALLGITQMIGRGRRAPDDRCETFILDKNLPLVLAKGRRFHATSYSVHHITDLPKAPPKIIRGR